jgi:hypothetical protein
LRLAASALTAGGDGAKAGLSRTGPQPDGNWSRRARNGSMALGGGSRNCVLVNPAIDLGRAPECHFLKGFNVLNPIAHLVADFEEQRPGRFSPPALQSRLANPPAFGQLGLGHASSVHSLHLSAGVVGTVMKALFAGKAKWAVSPVRKLN